MEQTNTKPEPQAQPPVTEPTAAPAPRPWVTPTFERVPLNEALLQTQPHISDGMYLAS